MCSLGSRRSLGGARLARPAEGAGGAEFTSVDRYEIVV
jgi:hypothetical protein